MTVNITCTKLTIYWEESYRVVKILSTTVIYKVATYANSYTHTYVHVKRFSMETSGD